MSDNCPLCGGPMNWDKRQFRRFSLGDVAALPAGVEYEHRAPVREASIESDVVAPGLQAAISGVAAGILGGAVAVPASLPPLVVAFSVGSAGFSLAWFILLGQHRRLLYEVERVTGADLDGDGVAGQPDSVPVEIIERNDGNLRRIRYADIALSDSDLERVARALFVERAPFSRRGLSDELTQSEYSAFYESMLSAGLLVQSANSNELTAAGRSFLRQYL